MIVTVYIGSRRRLRTDVPHDKLRTFLTIFVGYMPRLAMYGRVAIVVTDEDGIDHILAIHRPVSPQVTAREGMHP